MNPKLDIDPQALQIIKKILQRNLPVDAKIWVFGSRAKHTAKKYSDIDLAIDAKTKLPFALLAALAYDFEESDLPYKVDIVDFNAIDPSFRKYIDQEKILLNYYH